MTEGRESEAITLARAGLKRAEAARAAGDVAEAERWLERCHRLLPQDHHIALQLALISLGRDSARAEDLFATVAEAHDRRDAWLGLATARLTLGNPAGAAAALATVLCRHALSPQVAVAASQIARAAGAPGWCGLANDGRLTLETFGPGETEVRLDGRGVRTERLPAASLRRTGRSMRRRGVRTERLPAAWVTARTLSVTVAGEDLIGSPIDVAAISRVEGYVEAWAGGLRGWVWHPGDPDTDPVLTIDASSGGRPLRIVATQLDATIPDRGPQACLRRFWVPAEALRGLSGLLSVRGGDGQDLAGSPLDPMIEQHAATAAAGILARLYPLTSPPGKGRGASALRVREVPPARTTGAGAPPSPGAAHRPLPGGEVNLRGLVIPSDGGGPFPTPAGDRRRRVADVVIPVHGNTAITQACLDSVLASVRPPNRVIVVDDASVEPDLVQALDDLAAASRISLIRHTRNLGFPAGANAGIAACPGRDVVLLSSNTLVPPGWLERLHTAAYSAADIGSVTPLSNDAALLTWRAGTADGRVPDMAETTRLDQLAQRANGTETVPVPVGGRFCVYLRRDCLDAVGLLRADLFAQGPGETVDFCLRARPLGWRHVALPGLFVAHDDRSRAAAERHLRARNEALLHRLHPGYGALIAAIVAADPLAEARRRLDLLRWRAARRRGGSAVVLITHDEGGGVEQRVRAAVAAHRQAGQRAIVLRPARLADRRQAVLVCDGAGDDYPDLRFAMPDDLTDLTRLLRNERIQNIEVHHFLNHHPSIYQLLNKLARHYDVHVHDYPWFCQRVSLVGVQDRYCGEPDPAGCEACIADAGSMLNEAIDVMALLHRSSGFLSAAHRVVVPSEDAAARMQRHFPTLQPIVIPHEDDAAVVEPAAPQARDGRCRVVVVGAIGVHKGYDILLACARDAARRDLPLDFIVVGTSIDDARLMATGRIFVTGAYRPGEAVELIRRQNASLALLPSIWPETWCLGLTEIWRAGLRVAAFDLGAPAERIRRTGRGLLLPANLPPRAINNVLVASVGLSRHESLLPHERK